MSEKETRNPMIQRLCDKLDNIGLGALVMLKYFDQNYIASKSSKEKTLIKLKLCAIATQYVGERTESLTKQCRKSTKQGIRHPIVQCIFKIGNHIGYLKFVFKVNGKDNKKNKLIEIASFEEICLNSLFDSVNVK